MKRKRILNTLLCAAMVFALLPAAAQATGADVWDGAIATSFNNPESDGTAAKPYEIATGAQLAFLAQEINKGSAASVYAAAGVHFKLMNDIDLDGRLWPTIGRHFFLGFQGNFDGGGHAIVGLNVDATPDDHFFPLESYAGLFGCISSGGMVCNLSVSGTAKTANGQRASAGGVAGQNWGTIVNCRTACALFASGAYVDSLAGGVVGYNRGTIKNCYSIGTVTTNSAYASYAGGVAGANLSTIESCYWRSGDGMPANGIGLNNPDIISSIGSFTGPDGALTGTDGTNLDAYGADLLSALNAWIADQATPAIYRNWMVVPEVNDGYPFFATLAAPSAGIDYVNETLTGLVADAQYSIGGGAPVSADADGEIAIASSWLGTTISIMRVGDGYSLPQSLSIPARPAAPTGLTGIAPSESGGTGSIAGVTAQMQYSSDQESWTDCPDGVLSGLAPDVYFVRCKADNGTGTFMSPAAQVEVGRYAGTDAPTFLHRTLNDSATGVIVSGIIHEAARLTVKPLALHSNDPACDAIREAQASKHLILGFDIGLSHGFLGTLTISIPVGDRYNGQSVTILHCINGRLETIVATVVNGAAAFTATELSPFAVTTGLLVTEITGIPNTGDAETPRGFVLIGLAAICVGYLVMRRRRA